MITITADYSDTVCAARLRLLERNVNDKLDDKLAGFPVFVCFVCLFVFEEEKKRQKKSSITRNRGARLHSNAFRKPLTATCT
jgi:hypothetical protein